jgi:hypothetical protein
MRAGEWTEVEGLTRWTTASAGKHVEATETVVTTGSGVAAQLAARSPVGITAHATCQLLAALVTYNPAITIVAAPAPLATPEPAAVWSSTHAELEQGSKVEFSTPSHTVQADVVASTLLAQQVMLEAAGAELKVIVILLEGPDTVGVAETRHRLAPSPHCWFP